MKNVRGQVFPYFIGVFDTVAAIASKASLVILLAAVVGIAAAAASALWFNQPVAEIVLGPSIGGFFARFAALIKFDVGNRWHWFFAVLAVFALVTVLWYVTQQIKYAPSADPEKPWRTLNISFGRMSFEDKTLNDNVR